MDNRERIIRLWFDMWLAKRDLGIFNVLNCNFIALKKGGGIYEMS